MPRKPKVQTKGVVKAGPSPKIMTNPGAPSLYANSIAVLVSIFDFIFIFGQQHEINGETVSLEVGRLNLSPTHAKALAGVLLSRVAEYEDRFGAIPLADGMTLSFGAPSESEQPS